MYARNRLDYFSDTYLSRSFRLILHKGIIYRQQSDSEAALTKTVFVLLFEAYNAPVPSEQANTQFTKELSVAQKSAAAALEGCALTTLVLFLDTVKTLYYMEVAHRQVLANSDDIDSQSRKEILSQKNNQLVGKFMRTHKNWSDHISAVGPDAIKATLEWVLRAGRPSTVMRAEDDLRKLQDRLKHLDNGAAELRTRRWLQLQTVLRKDIEPCQSFFKDAPAKSAEGKEKEAELIIYVSHKNATTLSSKVMGTTQRDDQCSATGTSRAFEYIIVVRVSRMSY